MSEPAQKEKGTSLKDDRFVIASIKTTEPPAGSPKVTWYRYVITQGNNTILGQRPGTKKGVTEAVEEIVEQLNLRRAGKSGRVHLSSNRKKKAAAK
jgi:hypothetical protein